MSCSGLGLCGGLLAVSIRYSNAWTALRPAVITPKGSGAKLIVYLE